jgi:hypothetical protein
MKKSMNRGYTSNQLETRVDTFHLAPQQPSSPYDDSVFFYKCHERQIYGGGGSPDINSYRDSCDKVHCIHARTANPPGLTSVEKFLHFYGRIWFSLATNSGLWGAELEKAAEASAKSWLETKTDQLATIHPPEVVIEGPAAYARRLP